jgi:membrane protease YdiL (CAAX protease family)
MSESVSAGNDFLRLRQLRTDWRAVAAAVIVTLAMTVEHYDRLQGAFRCQSVERVLLYLIVPLSVVALVFRESPARYGFQLGDWRTGLALTAVGCGALAVSMLVVARSPAFRSYYGAGASGTGLPLSLEAALDLIGWEFVFRGFLLFALYPVCGPLAIVLQAVPFTIAHFGKPELETLSCIFGGSALGYVAWRTRSFIYPFLIHWFLTVFTVLVASGAMA